jgi:hypothetical protein
MRTVTGMLSTAKIGTGSWRYYSNQVQRGACEYYLGVGEAPGRWQGRGLDALGLDPRAAVAELGVIELARELSSFLSTECSW